MRCWDTQEWRVREQAVGALRPFQFGLEGDEDDEALRDDRVRSKLMSAMMSDSQPQVRQAALGAVTKTAGMFDQASRRKRGAHTCGVLYVSLFLGVFCAPLQIVMVVLVVF